MDNFTIVYFKGISRGFSVASDLANFSFFGIQVSIKWYGAIIAFGFLLAVLLGGRGAYKWKMSLDKMIDVLIYGTILGIIGARLYYVLANWSYYKDNLSEVYKIYEGGLAIYGGLIGGLIAAFIVCKVRKLNFYNLLDLCAMSFLVGQGIGRWGNFTNQEVFGTNTNLPWGMWSQKTADFITSNQAELAAKGISINAGTYLEKAYVHPTFLYESLWCLFGFAVLYYICQKHRKFSGEIILLYGIWYGTGRAIIESFRLDGIPVESIGLSLNQVRSISLAVVCTVLLIVLLRKYKKNPKPIEGIDYFPAEEIDKKKDENKNHKEIGTVDLTENEEKKEINKEKTTEEANEETTKEKGENKEKIQENFSDSIEVVEKTT